MWWRALLWCGSSLPPASTFNRLVHAVADGQGLVGSAAQRRWHASQPAVPAAPLTGRSAARAAAGASALAGYILNRVATTRR